MIKTILLLGMTLILILSSISFSNATTVIENDIIYVDDSNTEGPWDGTVDHPFQYIQEGINAAYDADTVFVFAGNYYENIVIDKSICLRGENKDECFLISNVSSSTITIKEEKICLKEFTISGLDSYYEVNIKGNHTAIYNTTINSDILINSSNNKIYNNSIKRWICITSSQKPEYNSFNKICNNTLGTVYVNSSNNIICNNLIESDNFFYSVHFDIDAISNHFYDNNIISTSINGLLLSSDNNDIHNNTINDEMNDGVGILINSRKNNISNNVIKGGYSSISLFSDENIITGNVMKKGGIEIGIPLFLFNSYTIPYNNTIFNNLVNDKPLLYKVRHSNEIFHEDYGQIILMNCTNITIHHQNISHVKRPIQVFNSKNMFIQDNTFIGGQFWSECSEHIEFIKNRFYSSGIELNSCSDIIIKNNFIEDGNGIELSKCDDGIISRNNFLNVTKEIQGWTTYNMLITENNFYDFEQHEGGSPFDDVYLNYNHNKWEHNYWGEKRYLPKSIWATVYVPGIAGWLFRFLKFDWHPAQEPYDI